MTQSTYQSLGIALCRDVERNEREQRNPSFCRGAEFFPPNSFQVIIINITPIPGLKFLIYIYHSRISSIVKKIEQAEDFRGQERSTVGGGSDSATSWHPVEAKLSSWIPGVDAAPQP
ncbi:hypothetical protein PSTG_04675 [Puccinia striiformis f. sp. tritici PST-78]|uniref:Uncharacterized protein n=1 Tax=Puccinia striiformis f. sp. tritici PST-78 TaxID=1165861 RepID=A0A0L0VSB9_9BASI|nr:hypothetical protein PSTG_04675 [Puccinia striiformis f. sp. tritici PST-78]